MTLKSSIVVAASLLLAYCDRGQAQFIFATNHATLTITGYEGPGGVVSIPATNNGRSVVNIGNWAFFYCTNVTSVTIPATVTNIGYCAFYYCTNLTNATMVGGLRTIGGSAFCQCTALREAGIPATVTSIGAAAFYDCASLSSVTLPKSVASIGAASFAGCAELAAFGVDAANAYLTSLAGVLFTKARTTLIQYPAGSHVTSYTISNGVTTIDACAFYRCAKLASVTIPKGVTSIGSYAFAGCPGLDAVNFAGAPPSADSSIFFSEENGYSVPADVILNYVRTASGVTTNSPSIEDLNITRFPNFFKAMDPTNNPGPVTILCTGDSTMNSSQGAVETGYSTQLSKLMEFGGGIGSGGSGWNFANKLLGIDLLSPTVTHAAAPDNNWYSSYWTMPEGASLTNALFDGTRFFYTVYTNFDRITVAYIAGPNESTNFAIQTVHTFGGAPTTVATINASNRVYHGVVTNIAVPAGNFDGRIEVKSSQPAHILAFGCVKTNGHNFIMYNAAFGAQHELLWTNVNTNIFIPIMRAINPALVIFQNKNNNSNQVAAGYRNFIHFWSNALPNADHVHLGEYQTVLPNYDNAGMDVPTRSACLADGKPFVDLYYDMPPSNTMNNLNWYIDGAHLRTTSIFEGGLIWDRLFATLGALDFSDVKYWNAPKTPRKTTAYYYFATGWKTNYAGIPALPWTPTITVVRAGAHAVLSWPVSAGGFHLEESPTAAPNTWTKSAAPLSTNDGIISTAATITGGHQYYRLRLP